MAKKIISVIIPVFNEQDNIKELISKIKSNLSEYSFKDSTYHFEFIFIDDGSTDLTLERLKEHCNSSQFLYKSFAINRGKSEALAEGIKLKKADYIAFMDGDCQDHPEELISLLKELLHKDADVAMGWRFNRQDSFLKKLVSKIYNITLSKCFGVNFNDINSGLKLFKPEVAKKVRLYGNNHRSFALLSLLEGFKVIEIPVQSSERFMGKTKYSLFRIDGMVSLLSLYILFKTYKNPMLFFGKIAFYLFSISIIVILLLTMQQLFYLLGYSDQQVLMRPILALASSFLILAFLFFLVGFICEYILFLHHSKNNE
jgi:glycosyltransferase involved in cell wall biosynthesis